MERRGGGGRSIYDATRVNWLWVMMFNATFNNTSVTLWRSVLLVEETGITPEKNTDVHKSLTNFIT